MTTRANSSKNKFGSQSEANCFFRADISPLVEGPQKKQFYSLQKRIVNSELNNMLQVKKDLLHKSL